ncbi:hypothetical protein LX15_005148 [Streptoalloteichus tenebrarius]|uniref:Uncharacterized protein n=1 Tax=Streptoalloteichus tenebrarius (strain ATCC 17920 / DSM 40477 / JCM 4838 / CBS 697.72 / NBRC 16177 / NCIMB 11028 / NRRL B-12390 / A12253. 1 / ISP 5477) TaxID=1933 RepID=A0ABT1I0X7_STRSD|nr:hypothetical protein [Streptoalloteichus tenebrarius]MCP2261422.1 hypothetical protein [Streptoalloteichus tenebrarius]BFF02026.1 hypothetical protein GCM10020241_37010 [Streptoalloteichus tenebrarius]
MARRWTRVATAVALAAGAAVTGAGSAGAAEPVVLGSCATTVTGAPGQPVALSPSAVAAPVVDLVRAVPGGFLLAEPANSAIRSLPPIPLGAIPAGGGQVTGGQIAQAVVAELRRIPLLGPVIGQLTARVSALLTGMCGVTLHAVNAVAAPAQDGAKAVADVAHQVVGGQKPGGRPPTPPQPQQPPPRQPQQPGPGPGPTVPGNRSTPDIPTAPQQQPQADSGGAREAVAQEREPELFGLARWDFGRAPFTDYSGLPFDLSDLRPHSPDARRGSPPPGLLPPWDGTGTGRRTSTGGVTSAGGAEALPAGTAGRVGTPVVLAMLSLAVVTAALVRRVAQRRDPN